ncbi:Cof-type HAD-IIB family hydrolase [Acinetobacter puyangensis]|uniref:Sugar-phosphatase n=1 Tax=Acinetobacter puyangensis TaxID=1096779 RepID=A0A240E592_9GAMM|nr:Cof-type HAD-IIB family hydrolase [Acinetobacter puyangensis]SNX43030.1 hypothetical protein/sugar-phosphatase [Acinetobacter puyangensis]
MPIKLIAVDMDGTFLNDNKQYNKTRFLNQYKQLKQQGIRFVAASGNQLYTLQNYFLEIQNDIAYVAENGAYVVDGTEEVGFAHFSPDLVAEIIASLIENYQQALIVCGKKSAYSSVTVPQQAYQKLNKYFKKLKISNDLMHIDDQICKVTLNIAQCDENLLLEDLKAKDFIQNQSVKLVSSGFGFIDLIIPAQHKAHGLSLLQQKWQIADQDILAIGDNYNDLEMIQKAGFSFAMDNAVPELKQAARFTAKSNQQEGVLDVIDLLLAGEYPFQPSLNAVNF